MKRRNGKQEEKEGSETLDLFGGGKEEHERDRDREEKKLRGSLRVSQ